MKTKKKVMKKTTSSQKAKAKAEGKKTLPQKKKLFEFWGRECPHCKAMSPLIEKLKEELRVKVEQLEVWHNEKNARLYAQYDKGLCGGVPFFFNEATGEWLCGEVSYGALKAWARGKKKKV